MILLTLLGGVNSELFCNAIVSVSVTVPFLGTPLQCMSWQEGPILVSVCSLTLHLI